MHDPKKTFLIADTHFGDSDIIRYENRPFMNTKHMEESIIRNWNEIVWNDDEVYHLGDIGYSDSPDKLKEILSQLHGKKYLIKGNHDTKDNNFYRNAGFDEVYDHTILLNGFYLLSHEPLYMNANMPYFNIFGHVHDNPSYKTSGARSHCVCVERTNYKPILLSTIQQTTSHVFLLDTKQYIETQTALGADKTVIKFILDILLHNGKDASEYTRNLFRNGYCYYFAHMLKQAFRRGEVCWAAPYSHFVWYDEDGTLYDIEGIYNGEAELFIPEHYLGDAIYDFLHVNGLDYNASQKDIDRIMNAYWSDLTKEN